jgi:hypothetical protein
MMASFCLIWARRYSRLLINGLGKHDVDEDEDGDENWDEDEEEQDDGGEGQDMTAIHNPKGDRMEHLDRQDIV